MSVEANKAIARRFAQVWAPGNFAILDELAAPDLVVSYPVPPDPIHGPEAFKILLGQIFGGLPDATVSVDEEIAEADKVAVGWTLRGTHKGELLGIPPTNRSVEVTGITFYRIAGGKVVEERGIGNTLGLLRQLGLFREG
jgi:steroid delta-isomerase-like uncharacterized protein